MAGRAPPRTPAVSILGKSYRVVRLDPGCAPDFMGTNSRHSQTITIVEGQGPDQEADTIMHEALHIISDELTLGLTEEQIARLAVALFASGVRIPVVK